MSMYGAISWTTMPSNMAVRTSGAVVHRVHQLVGSDALGEEVMLECGARAPRNEASETEDPVDCMACMTLRVTTNIEAEIAEVEAQLKQLEPEW